MRVAHVLRKYNPAEWGGTETAIQRLFDGLRQNEVVPIVYCPRLQSNGATNDPLRDAGYEIKRFNACVPIWGISAARRRQLISVGGNLLSFELIRSLLEQPDIALIHSHTLGRLGGSALWVARRRGLPFVVTIHGGALDLPAALKDNSRPVGGWEWGRVFGALLRVHRLFHDADAVVACNENEAGLLRKKYPNQRIVVQRHGVSLPAYQTPQREAARAAFPQIQDKRVLLCVSRIDPIKNQMWLIEQLPAILAKYPDTLLVLAGACTDEHYGTEITAKIRALGLQDRVLLTGGLPPADPRLIGLFQEAQVTILASSSETFGLVILEAWAAGVPVISSRTSGAASLVRNGENSFLFDLENPKSFHKAVDQILTKSELRRRFVDRGCELVSKEYNSDALAGRMKVLYEQLIEEKNALRHSTRRRHQRSYAR